MAAFKMMRTVNIGNDDDAGMLAEPLRSRSVACQRCPPDCYRPDHNLVGFAQKRLLRCSTGMLGRQPVLSESLINLRHHPHDAKFEVPIISVIGAILAAAWFANVQ